MPWSITKGKNTAQFTKTNGSCTERVTWYVSGCRVEKWEKNLERFQISHHSMSLLHKPKPVRMLRNVSEMKQQQSVAPYNFYMAYQFFWIGVEKSWKLGNSPSHLWILIAASVEFWLNNKPDKVWHKLLHCRKPSNAEVQSSAAAFPVDFFSWGKGGEGRGRRMNPIIKVALSSIYIFKLTRVPIIRSSIT